jgi:hypothetical protein
LWIGRGRAGLCTGCVSNVNDVPLGYAKGELCLRAVLTPPRYSPPPSLLPPPSKLWRRCKPPPRCVWHKPKVLPPSLPSLPPLYPVDPPLDHGTIPVWYVGWTPRPCVQVAISIAHQTSAPPGAGKQQRPRLQRASFRLHCHASCTDSWSPPSVQRCWTCSTPPTARGGFHQPPGGRGTHATHPPCGPACSAMHQQQALGKGCERTLVHWGAPFTLDSDSHCCQCCGVVRSRIQGVPCVPHLVL